jgi:hypothetical protein
MPPTTPRHPLRRAILPWVVSWVPFAGLWLLLAAKLSTQEVAAAAVAAVVGVAATYVFGTLHLNGYRPTLRQLALIRHLPGTVLSDSLRLLRVAAHRLAGRPPGGVLTAASFDPGGPADDDPAAAARRALVVAYTNVGPNTVVLGIIPEQHLLLYHQLDPGGNPVPRVARELGAKP